MAPLARCSASVVRSFLYSARQCRFSSSNAASTPSRQRILPTPRLDYRSVSENMVYKSTNALNRKAPLPMDAIQSVARAYTEFKNLTSTLNSQRNARSAVGERIRRSAEENNSEAKEAAMAEALKIKEEIARLEAALVVVEENLLSLALAIPNDTHPSSPLGPESAAVTLSTHGPEPIPATPERDHVTIARKFGLVDFESGATVTGSSWYYLLNEAAILEMALTNYALSMAVKHGFTPVTTPDVVRSEIAERCGFQPRDNNADPPVSQVYHIHSAKSPELILSATSEIPLGGMFANKILSDKTLPLKVVGVGRAFRAEAGARGRDTHGLYRVHQFTKVELFAVTAQEESEKMMEEMKSLQTAILNGLGLSFRVLDMPTEELGASAYRKYDMEAWMPGRGAWGEVSSLSNCTDYQSRRLHIRYKSSPTVFAHTLNGTAAAIPRLMIALLENGAKFDELGELVGITLPETLRPFWIGQNERQIIQWQ
ncbi:Serine--tRNA ligase, chloroplastic/mitochondrial [Mycena venus]|uniref:serine--tRNA ligase n=1 Tax=Mycena venus TaxID=2733690 RepID=A0A8H6XWN4_9AGAR|nr:Serine--tRNA ligase, chloroplastic/mitochondrial [Mycena venus]